MSKTRTAQPKLAATWDELIACAEARLQRNSRRTADLRALVRLLEERRTTKPPEGAAGPRRAPRRESIRRTA